MKKGTRYNGWANYETWNVILWIDNDEGLRALAEESGSYKSFMESLRDIDSGPITFETPDNVAWNDSGISLPEVNNWFKELMRGVH